MVVEIMGRDAGWLALLSGLAGGADVILIPEVKFNYDNICQRIEERRQRGKQFSIIAVAEGAAPEEIATQVTQKASVDAFGHVRLGGIGSVIAEEIEKRTGYETRATILGHLQRGGTPTAYDRIMATRLGVKAVELVHNSQFDKMACVKGNQIDSVPLEEAVAKVKPVDMELFEMAKLFY
jgi:6-phosphofructokinase 1